MSELHAAGPREERPTLQILRRKIVSLHNRGLCSKRPKSAKPQAVRLHVRSGIIKFTACGLAPLSCPVVDPVVDPELVEGSEVEGSSVSVTCSPVPPSPISPVLSEVEGRSAGFLDL